MLIEFTVGNFRSFKEPVTLSMAAAKLKARDEKVNQNNTIVVDDKLTLLTSAAIYGANASGKSNLVKAFAFMRAFTLDSAKATQANEKIGVAPFRLSTETEKRPSFFEIVFLLDNLTYRYGFEVDQERVVSEWLFYVPRKQEVRLFVRDEKGIAVSRQFKGGAVAKKLTRSNALFLSVAAQLNSETAIQVLDWFLMTVIISGLDDTEPGEYSAQKYSENARYHEEILRLIRGSDVDIKDVIAQKGMPPVIPAKIVPQKSLHYIAEKMQDDDEVISFKTAHTKRNSQGQAVENTLFDLGDESEGTLKLFQISGPIVDVLLNGRVLFIDEIEARLHTHLTRKLIQLFNSKATNPKQAQIVFATHDTNLLSNKLFRRDQIWFVEKDQFSASHLYSLAEIKIGDDKIRNDASFEDDYLQGRYGAIPLLGELRQIFIDSDGHETQE